MKKKLIAAIATLTALLLCASGCGLGSYIDNGGKRPGSSTDKPDDDPDNPVIPPEEDDHYRASVYYGGELFLPGETDVYVVWRNSSEIIRVKLGADGRADAGALDGDYRVYLEGLPAKYAYDPNDSTATSDERKVSVSLEDIQQPVSGNGEGLYTNYGCYSVQYEGIYRTAVRSEFSRVYYEYTPTAAGVYSIESKVNVYDDEINPVVDVYGGSSQYKWKIRTVDAGGFEIDGGYTRNFRHEVWVDKTEVGSAFTFAVGAQSKSRNYPVDVDFKIKYEGEYANGNSDVRVKRAEEAFVKAENPKEGEKFLFADECPRTAAETKEYADRGIDITKAKIFDAKYVRFNPDTNFYHYYNEEMYGDNSLGYGKGYGPILCCAITKSMPSYPVATISQPSCLYNCNSVGLGSNFLRISSVWLEEEQKYATLDYTQFIRTDYYRVINNDGVCYVTRELKDFLQKYAENYSLYTDGLPAGEATPEDLGYSANQDALWLFACGFYM